MSTPAGHEPGSSPEGDSAPGYQSETREGVGAAIRGYLIGLVLASALTAASFWAASTHFIYGPGVPIALVVLAVAQMG